MKTNRIISIIMLLLNGKIISAPKLAKIFEVEKRTIYRDIDTIRRAGIPLVSEIGYYGGIGLSKDFIAKKNISSDSDISTAAIALMDEYPGLLDNNSYILAKHRQEILEREQKKSAAKNNRALIKVTLRFDEIYKPDIERQYNINIVSLDEDGFYEASIYIGADKDEYDKLLIFGEKCECVEPRHVRDYIKSKVENMMKIYNS